MNGIDRCVIVDGESVCANWNIPMGPLSVETVLSSSLVVVGGGGGGWICMILLRAVRSRSEARSVGTQDFAASPAYWITSIECVISVCVCVCVLLRNSGHRAPFVEPNCSIDNKFIISGSRCRRHNRPDIAGGGGSTDIGMFARSRHRTIEVRIFTEQCRVILQVACSATRDSSIGDSTHSRPN